MRSELDPWRREIAAILAEKRISNNAAAQAVGVSPATFASWMNGATRPSVEALPAIAELTGLALWRVYGLAGYLPETYAPATTVIQAVHAQRELYDELRRWAELSMDATGLSPAARAVGFIVGFDPTWQITVHPNIKGVEHHIASNTVLGLRRSRPHTESLHRARAEIEEGVGRQLSALGVLWRLRAVPGWNDPPPLLMEVPEYERTRPASTAPVADLPETIAVLGVPYAHAELVGALLAEAIGYGYRNTKTEVCLRYGLRMAASHADFARAAVRYAAANLITPPPKDLRHTVWTCTYPEAVTDDVVERLAADGGRTHVVLVTAGPRLIEFGAGVWEYPPQACIGLADRLASLAKRLPEHRRTVVEIPDTLFVQGGDVQDRVTDAAVEAARDALRSLVPPARRDECTGYLGELERAARR